MQDAPATSLGATCWRHIRHGRDPLSGAGARALGGRWNPPDSFPVLYLATDKDTVTAEFRRLAKRQGLGVESFLPRAMYEYDVALTTLLDVTDSATRDAVSLTLDDIAADELSACQAVGEAAYACQRSGVIAPSATGSGTVVAVFTDFLSATETVVVGDYEVWECPRDLPSG